MFKFISMFKRTYSFFSMFIKNETVKVVLSAVVAVVATIIL